MTPQQQQSPFTNVVFDIYRPIPSDTYKIQVTDLKEMASEAKPNEPFHAWTGIVADEDSDYVGKKVSWATSFNITPKSKGYQFYRACGLEELSEKAEFKPSDFIGLTCYMKVDLLPTGGRDGGPKNKVMEFYSEADMQKFAAKATKLMQNVTHKVVPKATATPAVSAVSKEVKPVVAKVTVKPDPVSEPEEGLSEGEVSGNGLTDFPQ